MADAILQHKTCTGCRIEKPLSEFHRHKRSKDGVRQRCKVCRADEASQDRSKNPEKYRAQHRKYYEKHREKVIERTSAYNKANPEILRNSMRTYRADPENQAREVAYGKQYRERTVDQRAAYRKANEVTRLEYNRRYRAENIDQVRDYSKNWKALNRDSLVAARQNRRARKTNAGTHTAKDIRHIMRAQGCCCANCETGISGAAAHLDHWMPLALGGTNTKENLQWLCATCNLTKGSTDPITWLERQLKACRWPKKN